MRNAFAWFSFIVLCFIASCKSGKQLSRPENIKQYYLQQIDATDTLVRLLKFRIAEDASGDTLQAMFKAARLAYKKAEALAAYYTPLTVKSINGAPVPEMDANDQHTTTQPEGFQVIEPLLFPVYDTAQKTMLEEYVAVLAADMRRLKMLALQQELADAQILDALRQEVFRVITLGISGFDSPVAQYSLPEAASALAAVRDMLAFYTPEGRQPDSLLKVANNAIGYLTTHHDFNSFDRMAFITGYANPLSRLIYQVAGETGVKTPQQLTALRSSAVTLFDADAFNPDAYMASPNAYSTRGKTLLGSRLFYDPVLSGNGKRSCASCHQPDKAFTDGLEKSIAFDGVSRTKRNTPTLLNAALQPSLFYDMRVAYLEDQATDVITSKDEMHGSLEQAVRALAGNPAYDTLFKKAFPEEQQPVTAYNLRNAIGSYIRSLISLNAPFDRYVRGDRSQLTPEQVRGFNLYMGKAKCGTCHFTPLFNGTVPPEFTKVESEVIGVPVAVNSTRIDPDSGRYNLRHIPLHRFAFRTPTLRNIALTAPYMHNGAYKTLEEVMDFYNKGGGAGLHMQLENQTLPFDRLDLSKKEQQEIIAFLHALTDTAAVKL
ncbi:cytochrome-c peroxidase [Chitinophaga oryzae]|uniref:Cytochrome-c peroxidase n=1 Tax=Chitinophaga oryzae TaxID=2725414 RepID=A0AAE6ZEI9_9BACT|nr:cytochrome c peroxidase [Chitinophaga oryzae]QJB30755.1 cytochrome-c peroxidase [Chitinophaga oryzae]